MLETALLILTLGDDGATHAALSEAGSLARLPAIYLRQSLTP